MNLTDKALESYIMASNHGVEDKLFIDRIVLLANKLESQGLYNKALDLLDPYRHRDPFLIHGILDRLSKKLLKK